MNKYKLLVTYVEAGMGHIVSAEAIANALEKYYPDEVEIHRCRIFAETNDKVLIDYEKFLIDVVRRSNQNNTNMYFMFFILNIVSPLFSLKFVHNLVFRKEKEKAIEIIKSYNPDMVISTHFAPLHFSIEAQKKYNLNYLTMCYCPDPNVHKWWDRRVDLLVVNNKYGYEECIKKDHVPAENVFLGRFILRKKILETPIDRVFMRKKYGLPIDNFTIILADGAYAKANLKKFADAFLKIDKKFTLLIIAGKNEKLYEYYKGIQSDNITIKVYRFVEDAHELYCAANLFVTKAGPNAILDSVYMETPIMANYYASPIEKFTKKLYIDEYQVGVYCDKAKEASKMVEQYIDNPSLLDQYRDNCIKFKKEGTGEKIIADRIMEELRKKK